MRRNGTMLFIGVAVTAIAMFGANTSLGTWKLNVAKSKSITANPIKSRTDVYEAAPGGAVKMSRTEERADGTTYKFSFTFKYDGKEYPVVGGPFDVIAVKRIDENTTTNEVRKTGGKLHQTSRHIISSDGKTRTQTATGTDADGKPVDATLVYDKQ